MASGFWAAAVLHLTIGREPHPLTPDCSGSPRPWMLAASPTSTFDNPRRRQAGAVCLFSKGDPMCGIIAAVAGRGVVSGDSLTRAVRRLDHCGPDGHRVWVAPNRRAGLGHARLSIIDLTTGDQPIANEDGRLHIVVNGEFYDFERDSLATSSGAATLPYALGQRDRAASLRRAGPALPARLRGEFAFAIWDERDGTSCSPRATASASSRCTTPCMTAHSTSPPR